ESLAVVRRHQLLEAVTGADEQVLSGNVAALEVQLALGDPAQSHHEFAPADAKAGRVTLHEDAADAVGAGAATEAAVDEIKPRLPRAGLPALGAVDAIPRRRLPDARFHVRRRRARGRLADRDGGLLAFEYPRKPPALLRLAAVGVERTDRAQVALDDDPRGDATGARDFLDHEDDVEERPSSAAVLGGHRQPHESGRRQVLDVVPGVFLGGVPARGALGERPVREISGTLAQRLLIGGELEVHAASVARTPAP